MGPINITRSMAQSIASISLIMNLILMGLGIYTMILIIKALKTYIKNNS